MNQGILNPYGGGPAPSATPIRVTQYTSGTGTFTPLPRTKWIRAFLLAGGSGGNSTGAAQACLGGFAASPVVFVFQKLEASYAYAVGAGGTGVSGGCGNDGGSTTLGTRTAYGPKAPVTNPTGGMQPGESSGYGGGGDTGANATGFGAGGGGTNGGNTTGGTGSGGLIIIEEY